jgi:hypothetical protein
MADKKISELPSLALADIVPGVDTIPIVNGGLTKQATVADIVNSAEDFRLRSDLAASGGSALVGFIQAGPGAVARTMQDKACEIISLFDFGAVCDGVTDDSAAMTKLETYINSITNTTGQPVNVELWAGVAPRVKFGTAVQFARPVYLYGHGITLDYTGTGAAITLGPSGLTANSALHRYYGAVGIEFTGGATATYGIYIPPWIEEPYFEKIKSHNFGTASGYVIFCQYNNWNCYFKDCNFYAGGGGYVEQSNFIKVAGVDLDGVTVDNGNSRANVIDTYMMFGGVAVGGVGMWLTGANSRVIGGGIAGAKAGILLGAGASYSEISGVYAETWFDHTTPPSLIQISDAGDPYVAAGFTDIKGVKVKNIYCNLHNYGDGFTAPTTSVFMSINSDAVKVWDAELDYIDLIEKKYELIRRPGNAGGHRIKVGENINIWGEYSADTYRLETGDAGQYRLRLKNKVVNLLPNPAFRTWAADLTAQAGAFTGYALASNITTSADGAGGSRTIARTLANYADGTQQILDMEAYYAAISCADAGTGNSYWTVDFASSAKYRDIVGQRVLVTFMAKAPATTSIAPYLLMQHINVAQTSHALDAISVNSSSWKMYSTYIVVPEVLAGVDVAASAGVVLELALPNNATFSCSIGNVMMYVGGIEYPLHCSDT